MRIVLWLGLCGVVLVCTGSLSAEPWTGWRGPRGDGTSLDQRPPTVWNGTTGENIAWKTPLPGTGHGSPIVAGPHVFLLACLDETLERQLVCLDRKSGAILWRETVIKSPLETKHQLNSYASSTPVTDGQTVFVTFLETDGSTVLAERNVSVARPVTPGKMVVAAYDLSGKQRWLVRPGVFTSVHGFCCNPVLWEDLVILNGDHDGESYIVALQQSTGEIVWKQPREHKTRSYVTPLIRTIGGRPQLMVSGSKSIVSLNPRTGESWWTMQGPTEQFVASMVYNGEYLFMAAGFPTDHVMAIKPDGQGDVTESHVAWHMKNAKCYVPSPVVIGDYLLVADDRGTGNCFDTKTGERYWQARLGKHYSGSLLAAGGRAYFIADDGITKIVEPGKTLTVVAENPLGEFTYSSPALSDGQLFIRGETHLYCIQTAAP